eukprot:TRINITY_DN89762_c0_g1_i1.p1 TRINITY_DN89762_c0_g1~~TRINITY_DN89762_c0_g1_i1.p1  ORF type:complete len:737 (+),score=118.99 TRINITY_DN89762_c0_g1_i1:85-2211(+)
MIREGSAEILPPTGADSEALPNKSSDGKDKASDQQVFYNPAQVVNRDMSIVVLNVFAEVWKEEWERRMEKKRAYEERRNGASSTSFDYGAAGKLQILEALAASGLRSIRYSREIPNLDFITVNDFDATAVEHQKRNLRHNGIEFGEKKDFEEKAAANKGQDGKERGAKYLGKGSGDQTDVDSVKDDVAGEGATAPCIFPTQSDAIVHCYSHPNLYNVIDLDPYGTVSPFLDGAIKGVKSGGLLCITSTDMPILGGNHPETAFYRYGGTAMKCKYVHEMSLRLLMNAVFSCAARHQRIVEPLISCSLDFYVRCFVRIWDKPVGAKDLACKTGLVYQCESCECFWTQQLGEVQSLDGEGKRSGTKKRPPSPAKKAGSADEQQANEADDAANGNQADNCDSQFADKHIPTPVPVCKSLKTLFTAKNKKHKVARNQVPAACTECDSRLCIGGPIYLGPLNCKRFLKKCLQKLNDSLDNAEREEPESSDKGQQQNYLRFVTQHRKIIGMFTAMTEEHQDIPLHYTLPGLCSSVRLDCVPRSQFKGLLRALGYRVSHFHREPEAIKTDAPNGVVYDVLRKWSLGRQKPESKKAAKKSKKQASHVQTILEKRITTAGLVKRETENDSSDNVDETTSLSFDSFRSYSKEDLTEQEKSVNFWELGAALPTKDLDEAHDNEISDKPNKIARFLPNPEKNWGPKARANPMANMGGGADA